MTAPTPQPHFTLSLTPTSPTCSLTSTPRFGLHLTLTLHRTSPSPLTLSLAKTPLKELHGLEEIAHITDPSGTEVEFPWGIGCWEYDEPFPSDEVFEEFEPGVPFEETFWLDREGPGAQGGELECLEKGAEYSVRVSSYLLASFGKWRWGRKGELLAGGLEEKREKWKGRDGDGRGRIVVEVSEPFTFRTV